MANFSKARLHYAQESINDIDKKSNHPLGTRSDDEDIDVKEEEDDDDVCEEKVKELLIHGVYE